LPAKISHTSYDYSNGIIVPVIASFDTEGHMRPLYVRIGGNSFKIHSSWLKSSLACSVFQCQIIDNKTMKPLILTYHPLENVWTVPENKT